MAYTMKKRLANESNYGGRRALSTIKYIVIHYTGNDGDTDENNGKYFANNIVKASAHYFVDDDSVTQSVPDNYVAYSVGGKKYNNCNATGGGRHHGKCTNANSLNVELCDDIRNGVVYPSAKTIENAVDFVKGLMKKYNIPASNVIRHFDVTGKSCPAYWVNNSKWISEFWGKLTTTSAVVKPVNKEIKVGSTVRVRKDAKTFTGGKLASFVYERLHKVKSINGDRVVITYNGVVVAAVRKSDLILIN